MGEQNHINGLESLKDELNIITKAKNELEKRLQMTVIEKETIFSSLEEALDRIHTLERHTREQESKLQVNYDTFYHIDEIKSQRFMIDSLRLPKTINWNISLFAVNDTALGPSARGKQCAV